MLDRNASTSSATRSARIGQARPGNGIECKSVQEKRATVKEKVRAVLVPSNNDPWPEVRDTLNRSLRGWSNYFCHGTRSAVARGADHFVHNRVRAFLARRHKVQGRGNRQFTITAIHRRNSACCAWNACPEVLRCVPAMKPVGEKLWGGRRMA